MKENIEQWRFVTVRVENSVLYFIYPFYNASVILDETVRQLNRTKMPLLTPFFSNFLIMFFSRISEKWSLRFCFRFIVTFVMAAIMTGPTSRMELRDWLLASACALRLVATIKGTARRTMGRQHLARR
jgi:hypothetical protein